MDMHLRFYMESMSIREGKQESPIISVYPMSFASTQVGYGAEMEKRWSWNWWPIGQLVLSSTSIQLTESSWCDGCFVSNELQTTQDRDAHCNSERIRVFLSVPKSSRWTEKQACWPPEVFLTLSPISSFQSTGKGLACLLSMTPSTSLWPWTSLFNLSGKWPALRDKPLRIFDFHKSHQQESTVPSLLWLLINCMLREWKNNLIESSIPCVKLHGNNE